MKGIDLLEKMDQVSPEYIEEADKEFHSRKPRIIGYCIGMAASVSVLIFSAYLWNKAASYSTVVNNGEVDRNTATIISRYGNLPPVLLMISVAFFGLFTFLLIRYLRYDRR